MPWLYANLSAVAANCMYGVAVNIHMTHLLSKTSWPVYIYLCIFLHLPSQLAGIFHWTVVTNISYEFSTSWYAAMRARITFLMIRGECQYVSIQNRRQQIQSYRLWIILTIFNLLSNIMIHFCTNILQFCYLP